MGRARRLSAVCSAVAPTIPSKALVGSEELSWPLQQLARGSAKLHCPLRLSAPFPPVDGMISSISCRPPTSRFMSGLLEGTSARRRQRVAADVDLTRLLGPARTKLRVYLAVFGPQRATSLHRWLLLKHHLQGLRQKKERERGDTLDETVPPETSEWRS